MYEKKVGLNRVQTYRRHAKYTREVKIVVHRIRKYRAVKKGNIIFSVLEGKDINALTFGRRLVAIRGFHKTYIAHALPSVSGNIYLS